MSTLFVRQFETFLYAGKYVLPAQPLKTPFSDRLLDVLASVTTALSNDGDAKCIVVLQFKTQAMGGDTFERDHLLVGRQRYIWHNPTDEIRLFSLICSESLTFDQAELEQLNPGLHPSVIFHPQLIPDPQHIANCGYRSALYDQELSGHVEIQTLNWARGHHFAGAPPNRYGGSAIYTKSEDFDLSDTRIDANHQRGLFYTFWGVRHTDLCFLSYDEHIFHYRMPKAFQKVKAALARRTGPEMLSLLSWDSATATWIQSELADDGFRALCDEFEATTCDYCSTAPHTALDRERLLTISAGKLRRVRDWYEVRNLESFTADTNERSRRLTFTHEQEQQSEDFRREFLKRYIRLQLLVLKEPTNYPTTIQDLIGDSHLRPPHSDNQFRFNLVSNSGNAGATAIFLGLETREFAKRLLDDLLRSWESQPEKTRRLVVWYETPTATIQSEFPRDFLITDAIESPASITRSSPQ